MALFVVVLSLGRGVRGRRGGGDIIRGGDEEDRRACFVEKWIVKLGGGGDIALGPGGIAMGV